MLLLPLLVALLTLPVANDDAPYFTSDPTLSPDGQTIVFTYEGDLWQVPSPGGRAVRLTAMAGEETHARFSPDGRWLAFTGRQSGNADVYLLPLDGGAIQQLTVHSDADLVDGWSWDSQRVYFSSSRQNRISIYTVAVTGGTPTRLFGHVHNTVHHGVEHPETGAIYFTDTWESFLFAHRKRYRGAYNPDLKSYDPASEAFQVHTSFEGKDFWPTIDRSGTVYFASDRASGEYNLYRLTDGEPEPLTSFPTSIKRPHVSADGSAVVFERDYQLYRYDVAAGRATKVPIQLPSNNTLTLAQDFNVKGEVTAFDVAPDKKKLAFVSRGELFVAGIDGKVVRELPAGDGRVVTVTWLADNETLLFNQTVGGYLNWFTIPADGSGPATQRTDEARNNQALTLNPERTQAAYLSGRGEVRLLDLETFAGTTIATPEIWALYPTTPAFSPDGQYLAFTAYHNFEQDLMLYHLPSGTVTNLTNSGVTETDPFWSPDGRYLYFTADRTAVNYPRGNVEPDLYRMRLTRFAPPFKAERFEKLFAEEDTSKAEEEPPTVTIELDGLDERWERVNQLPGSQANPFILQKDETTTVLFLSDHDEGKTALWKTVMQPFEETKTEKVTDVAPGHIVAVDGTVYVLARGGIHTLDVDGGKLEAIELDHTFRRSLAAEFEQMYYETWANLEENYYDETFQGTDWTAMRDRYAAFLPHLRSRENLRTLLNDLLGELNSSHIGFYSSGDEEDTFYERASLTAGLLFEDDAPYTVRTVVERGALHAIGADVRPGDVLVAVDGERVDPSRNREAYFVRPSRDEEVALTFRRGDDEHTVRVQPESPGALKTHLYDAWIAGNQDRVDAATDERVAYVHMKNMGGGSLEQFLIEMTTEAYRRDALILDLRYNTGGNVHDDVLQFLRQTAYLQWKYRGGELTDQPAFTPADQPMVLLVNEQSLSDAEMTTAGFKALGLGPVIGTETYRWIIFTSGKGLVDGSFYRLPSWGCYTLDGTDLERSGVAPDIPIANTFVDRLTGADPQLDRAIQEVLGRLEQQAAR